MSEKETKPVVKIGKKTQGKVEVKKAKPAAKKVAGKKKPVAKIEVKKAEVAPVRDFANKVVDTMIAEVKEAVAPLLAEKTKAAKKPALPDVPKATAKPAAEKVFSVVKSAMKAAVQEPKVAEQVAPVKKVDEPIPENGTFLQAMSTRKPAAKAATPEKTVAGKVNFSQIKQVMQERAGAPKPAFDVTKYLSK